MKKKVKKLLNYHPEPKRLEVKTYHKTVLNDIRSMSYVPVKVLKARKARGYSGQ